MKHWLTGRPVTLRVRPRAPRQVRALPRLRVADRTAAAVRERRARAPRICPHAIRSRPTRPTRRCSRRSSGRRPSPGGGSGARASRHRGTLGACRRLVKLQRSPRPPVAVRMALDRERPVAASGNGHSADEGRVGTSAERIAAARSRMQVTCRPCVASSRRLAALAGAGAALAAWGLFESQWVRGARARDRRARASRRARRADHPAPVRLPRRHPVAEHARAAQGGRLRRRAGSPTWSPSPVTS